MKTTYPIQSMIQITFTFCPKRKRSFYTAVRTVRFYKANYADFALQNSTSSDVHKLGIDLMEQRRTEHFPSSMTFNPFHLHDIIDLESGDTLRHNVGFRPRPAWSTGILIPCGFLSGIAAALLVWRGGQKTKRVAKVEERLRAALAASDDVVSQQQTVYPPRRGYTRKMTDVSEGLEEPEVRIDEQMTIPGAPGPSRATSD
ncbi:hypothetical protein C0993_000035 [Termitomyces sp. T159_Od127]|nr:hypothetical protein C0993_000035 [Termitomyces sp. T159_Od127]